MNLTVVVRMPRTLGGEVTLARAIVQMMAANPKLFPKPVPTLSIVNTHVDDFQQAIADSLGDRRAIVARKMHRQSVRDDVEGLRAYVQGLARANPEEAAILASKAGMALRKPRSFTKALLDVKQLLTGNVKLVAKAVKAAGAYEWEVGTDGVTFERLASSTQASTTVTGLTPGTKYWFRFRAIVKTGPTSWSDAVWAIVT